MNNRETLTNKIKIFNYVLIGLLILLLIIILPLTLKSGGEDDPSALLAFPIIIVGCGYISILVFELIDLKFNRGFFQLKAIINSIIMLAPWLILLWSIIFEEWIPDGRITIEGSDWALFVADIVFLFLFIYHGFLAIKDRRINKKKMNIKHAIFTTIGLIITIPVLILLVILVLYLFKNIGW